MRYGRPWNVLHLCNILVNLEILDLRDRYLSSSAVLKELKANFKSSWALRDELREAVELSNFFPFGGIDDPNDEVSTALQVWERSSIRSLHA